MHGSYIDFAAFPDGTSLRDIAEAVGVPVRDVRRSFMDPMPIAGKRRARPTAERDAEIVSRYRSLETVKEPGKPPGPLRRIDTEGL
jgi:hypothetical protein